MAVNNVFTITYGSRAIGGSSDVYQLHGPYVLDKSFESLRLVFDVVVVGTSYANLQSSADALETDLRKRDQDLVISLNGSTWTYTHGTDTLNTTASLQKSGDPETDRGLSRMYSCVVEAELPADDQAGLRDLSVNVDYESSRQKIVTLSGTYTSLSGVSASAQYQSDFGSESSGEAATALAAVDSGATWELVDENYTHDRNDHTCTFTHQYVELLVNQSSGSLNDTTIRDHRVVFTNMSNHPGDSLESVYRLRRVVANYDCAIDIDQSTDLQGLFDNTVADHVKELFQTNFAPVLFGIEDRRVGYDEATKRLSATVQFVYQSDGGDVIVEMSQSTAYRESRVLSETPTHSGGEHDKYVDPGWASLERVHSRTVIVVGTEEPKRRIGVKPSFQLLEEFEALEADNDVVQDGWNIVSNTSQVTPQWVGDPDDEQIELTVLTETVVERFNKKPDSGGTRAVPTSGTSGGASSSLTRGGSYGWRGI